jgi:hypothetical protein
MICIEKININRYSNIDSHRFCRWPAHRISLFGIFDIFPLFYNTLQWAVCKYLRSLHEGSFKSIKHPTSTKLRIPCTCSTSYILVTTNSLNNLTSNAMKTEKRQAIWASNKKLYFAKVWIKKQKNNGMWFNGVACYSYHQQLQKRGVISVTTTGSLTSQGWMLGLLLCWTRLLRSRHHRQKTGLYT